MARPVGIVKCHTPPKKNSSPIHYLMLIEVHQYSTLNFNCGISCMKLSPETLHTYRLSPTDCSSLLESWRLWGHAISHLPQNT